MVSEKDRAIASACMRFERISPLLFKVFREKFGSPEEVWSVGPASLQECGMPPHTANAFCEFRKTYDYERAHEQTYKLGIQTVMQDDPEYPALLGQTYDAPFILFYRGALPTDEDTCFSVVGARKVTSYGKSVTPFLVRDLARTFTIVSGLCYGVDTLAHQAVVDVKGKTIAVLGTGIDDAVLYPSVNRQLAQRIVEQGGCVLSEYAPGTPGQPWHFAVRDRIIAGLSVGTLVIEAGEKSGALITAQCALSENREVFAVPGNITSPLSFGTNDLIKKGAHVVTCAEDITRNFSLEVAAPPVSRQLPLNETEHSLLSLLSHEPLHIDDIGKSALLDIQTLSATLLLMEMKGIIKDIGNRMYIRL